ncbi:uncharacterized protein LOC129322177 [Prosopis cineraria]|uniref:uncharacterized protein LOC129322177 n=1 Tax=Prosopis cineraria TaxID=364024 RepID=UPI00240F3835|nr:uncharacterized protein LOC129322177 [Prosopis cineraria]XP_054824270.1 uncharacterized protein LOC129322177 [Prosopis cineraria]XP_054824271.1 uncharacterized protein LOC129322177 [Prosopis cineraria]
MKQRKQEIDCGESKTEEVVVVARPPPPPPPLPRFPAFSRHGAEESVTRREIARFWRQKRIEEHDHLLAAIKAAAKLRARNLTEQDYMIFQESLEKERGEDDARKSKNDAKGKEVRVGIKDWWTKSKYAYLNQPAIDSTEPPKKRGSTYIPNCLSYKHRPLCSTSIGVF